MPFIDWFTLWSLFSEVLTNV